MRRPVRSVLARPVDTGVTPAEPLHGGVFLQPYLRALATDMHQAFEIIVLLSGQEDRHCEDWVFGLEPGDVWLTPAWEPHGWRATAPETRELVLQFRPEFLGEETLEGVSWLSLFAAPPRYRPRATTAEMRRQVLGIADEMSQEVTETRRGWLTAVRLSMLRLLFAISRDWKPPGPSHRRRYVRTSNLARITAAMELLHGQAAGGGRVSVAEAAAACSLSSSHFCLLFRETMGLSFGKLALRARLAYAAQLLLSTDSSMEAIAERFGFVDVSHFYRAFTKHYGSTPARYRAEGRAPGPPRRGRR